jgi:two-component system KDP operon response regulator KdpE
MAPAQILLIGDEPNLLRTIKRNLLSRGYEVALALDDHEAFEYLAHQSPDLFVLHLDFTTIQVDGLAICARLREVSQSPVIVLSATSSPNTKIQALDLGADDYVMLPFSMDEFLARVRSALRRWFVSQTAPSSSKLLLCRDLRVDLEAHQVTICRQLVHLTPREYDILVHLARHAGKVITHRELLQAVWGDQYGDEREYLRVFVSQLRHKIEPDPLQPTYIYTEPGVGYRFATQGA